MDDFLNAQILIVADLNQVDETLLAKTPPAIVIKEVEDDRQLHDFKKVFMETFEIPDWAGQAWVDATHKRGHRRSYHAQAAARRAGDGLSLRGVVFD
jgi:hypothetical protein